MSEWLEEYLIQFRGAVLLVTHDRYFLDRIVDRIVEVDQGKLYHYPGNYSEYIRLKEERQDMALASERKRKSLLRTELKWLGRGARARSTKQKAHIDRIKAMQEVQDIQEERRVLLDSVASRMGSKTIELSEICKSYGERALIKDYSYTFLKDDRIGIIGPNGCGKSTLLKIIHGDIQPDNGCIETGQTIRIGYFSQENEAMDGSMKVIDYVKEAGEYIATTDGRITASQMLENFLFDGAMQWSKIEKLSGIPALDPVAEKPVEVYPVGAVDDAVQTCRFVHRSQFPEAEHLVGAQGVDPQSHVPRILTWVLGWRSTRQLASVATRASVLRTPDFFRSRRSTRNGTWVYLVRY